MSVCVCMLTQLCPTLWNPVDCSPLKSSVRGISQARILDSVAISFSSNHEYMSPLCRWLSQRVKCQSQWPRHLGPWGIPWGSVLVCRYLGSVSVIFFLLEPTLKTYLASLLCFLLLQKMESLAQRGPCPSLWERYAYSRKTGERKKFLQSTRKSFILGSTGARELLDRVSHVVPLLLLPEESLMHNSEPRCQRRKNKTLRDDRIKIK